MDDDTFIDEFQNCTLPFEMWNHRAHVKMAFLLLRRHPFDEALDRMREGIKAYNAANDVADDGPLKGYNETTTTAFLRLIAATMQAYGEVFPTPTADSFCDVHPQLMNKSVLRLFYSPARRSEPQSKHGFVEPDLAKLPDPHT